MKPGKIRTGISAGDIVSFVLVLIGGIFTVISILLMLNHSRMQAGSTGTVQSIPVVFSIIGLSILCAGIITAMFSLHRRAVIRKVVLDGHYVMAEAVNIRQNLSITVNGVSPYVLECHYRDPAANTLHVFRSPNLFYYPAELLGSPVRVFVDPENLRHYYVDVDDALPDVQLH